eukprot:1725991-Rhodomonas_salina.1
MSNLKREVTAYWEKVKQQLNKKDQQKAAAASLRMWRNGNDKKNAYKHLVKDADRVQGRINALPGTLHADEKYTAKVLPLLENAKAIVQFFNRGGVNVNLITDMKKDMDFGTSMTALGQLERSVKGGKNAKKKGRGGSAGTGGGAGVAGGGLPAVPAVPVSPKADDAILKVQNAFRGKQARKEMAKQKKEMEAKEIEKANQAEREEK